MRLDPKMSQNDPSRINFEIRSYGCIALHAQTLTRESNTREIDMFWTQLFTVLELRHGIRAELFL